MILSEPALLVVLVVLAGVLGTIIGSFLNVVVWRLPRGESLSHPGSACPRCGHPIRWWDNIPIASWLVLRGRCRDCSEPISPRYPLVELGTGLSFAGVAWWLLATQVTTTSFAAFALVSVALLYFAAISIALGLIDIDTHRLLDSIVLPSYIVAGVLLGAAALVSGDLGAIIRAAIGMAAMYLAYLAMVVVYPAGMGWGDVKLAGVLGLYLGWNGWGALAVGAFAAFALGGLFSLVLVILHRANRKSKIPFGPWMLLGAWVGVFAGETIARGYLALFGLGI
jgi:leader peptidase (prepilin peptidase)/N-methyltransferase